MSNRLRQFTTALLLLFVVASFVWMFVGERFTVTTASSSQPSSQPSARFTVYYFYGNKRCDTCQKMEAYSLEAVKAGFANDLSDGTLEWRVLNRERPENAHFVSDYELTTQAVIVADHQTGAWKDLFEIWTRVDNKPDFLRYIQNNLREFMNENGYTQENNQ